MSESGTPPTAPPPGSGCGRGSGPQSPATPAIAAPDTPPLPWQRICASRDLVDGGPGWRFAVPWHASPTPVPAFAIRFEGRAHAWVNRCAHIPVELDFPPARFFDDQARYIVCATHGAHYHPDSGRCAGGPCAGRGLVRLECREAEAGIWVCLP